MLASQLGEWYLNTMLNKKNHFLAVGPCRGDLCMNNPGICCTSSQYTNYTRGLANISVNLRP